MKEKKRFYVPNTYTLIVIFIIFAAILTYIVPAGEYGMVEDASGKEVVNPHDFKFLEQQPVGLGQFLLSVPAGMKNGAAVIFLTFLVGGFFQVINDTKAIDIAINEAINKMADKAFLTIPVIMVIMGILGAMGIVVNAVVAFIPIGIALARKLKIDPVAGVGIMYLSAYAGFGSSPMSPFTTLIGQNIAGLAPLSGFTYRFIVMTVLIIATIIYIYRYSKKVAADEKYSVFETVEWSEEIHNEEQTEKMKLSHGLVLLTLVVGFVIYGYGTYVLKWGLDHLSAMMFAVALISGLIVRMHPDDMAKSFIKGAQNMVYGALVIGFASAITIVLTEGKVIHSIIYYMTIPLTKLPSVISSIGMFIVNLIFNTVVPSGSGQAYIVMPLMAPMADVVNVSRQIAVLAYQYGDGFSNIIIPTSGVLMAVLGVAKIPYEKWVKFVAPIFAIWVSIGTVAIIVANLIGYV